MDYKDFYYYHPDKMQVLDIITLGRASSIFFQGFLDGHSKCFSTPNIDLYQNIVLESMDVSPLEEALDFLYEHHATRVINVPDAHLTAHFSRAEFGDLMKEYLKAFGISYKTLFIGFHYAMARHWYPQAWQNHIYIMTQTHTVHCFVLIEKNYLIHFDKDFPGRKTFFMVRDPRASWYSGRMRWPCRRTMIFGTAIVSFWYYLWLEKCRPSQILVVKHDDLHRSFPQVLKGILDFLGISYEPCLEQSTYYGIPFTGKIQWDDGKVFSNTKLESSFPNPIYAHEDWKNALDDTEIRFVQWFAGGYMKKFNYPFITKPHRKLYLWHLVPDKKEYFNTSKNENLFFRAAYCFLHIPFLGKWIVLFQYAFFYFLTYLAAVFYVKRIIWLCERHSRVPSQA